MPSFQIQPTFSGGEFNPSLFSRVDWQKYSTGLKKAKNFIIHPHGGASNRPGLHYIAKPKFADKKCRLIPFEFSSTQAYMIELGHLYCRFFMNGGQIAATSKPTWSSVTVYAPGDFVTHSGIVYYAIDFGSNHTPASSPTYWAPQICYEIVTTYTESEIKDIKFVQSADVLFITHPNHPPRMLARESHAGWRLDDLPYVGGPFMLSNTTTADTITASAVSGAVTLTSTADIFDVNHIGALFRIKHYIPSQVYSGQVATSDTSFTSIKCGEVWRLRTGGSWQGKITVQQSLDGGTVWHNVRSFSSQGDFNVNTYGSLDYPDSKANYSLIRVYCEINTAPVFIDLTSDPFTTTGIVRITSHSGPTSVGGIVETTVGDTSASADWAEGSWSTYRGFPSCIVFFQDRLTLAASASEPQTAWPSKTGNYYDFGRSSPLVDSDSISINLPSQKMNGIRNMVGLAEILALTASTEWSIGAGNGGVFSPTSIETKCHGYRGSSNIAPVVIGNRAIFVQPMGAILRDLGFDYSSDGFTGNDLSILASHLFEGKAIVEMAYQQEPDSIVWCVRDDGVMLSMTYQREHEVLAWTWHDTAGLFESVASIPGSGYNETWVVVKRGSDRFIERFDRRMYSTEPAEQFFIDCGLTYRGSPATVITGLEHLNNKQVAILADGNVVNGLTVSGGQVTIPTAASIVHVGLPYVSDLETLNIEVQTQDGTMQGRTVKISMVTFRFLNARAGWVGPDADNLTEIIQNTGVPLGTPEPLFTGDFKETITSGYEFQGGRVLYRQVDPLPVTILAIMPTVTVGG